MKELINKANAIRAAIAALSITLLFLAFLPQTKLSYDFEKFFPEEDQELDFYLDHRSRFETDNDFILVALKPKEGIFNSPFIGRLDSLSRHFQKLHRVVSVLSLCNYKSPILGPFGWTPGPSLRIKPDGQYMQDSLRLVQDPLVYQNLISTDLKSTALIIRNDPKITKKAGDSLLIAIEASLSKVPNVEYHLAGKIHGQYHYIRKMAKELAFFTGVSLVLLCVFLYFTFRTAWGIWLPISIVAIALIWLVGFINLIGKELNILCTILPTIIFVVGIADSVHILEKFVHEIRLGHSKLKSLQIAYKHVGFATLLTAITNAIGFITLMISNIAPIREFGLYTAIGIMFAFLVTYLVLPLALLIFPTPKVAQVAAADTFWAKSLPRLFSFTLKNRRWVLGSYALLFLISLFGISKIKINNFLLEDWSEKDPEKIDYVFFETHFAGVRPVEFQLKAVAPYSLNDSLCAQEIEKLELYLSQNYGARAIQSPNTLLKTLNRGANGGNQTYFALPNTPEAWDLIQDPYNKIIARGNAKALIDDSLKLGRLAARIPDYGGFVFKQKNAELNAFIQTKINPKILELKQTGMPMLIDLNNEHLSADIGYELGLSLLMVAALMGLLFRKVRIVIIALIPNLVPLVFVGGIMGYFGIDLKVSTSLIFSIAFGIAVDDTIHFMSNLKMELQAGRKPLWALRSTYYSTGKAVTITNLVLLSGFFSLIMSSFASTFYLGLLVSITLLVALISELTLMPILFAWLYKEGSKTES